MTDLESVRAHLGWPEPAREIMTVWDGLDAAPVTLPSQAEVIRALHRMGADEIDVADAVGARPDPEADPELWWILERTVAHLRSGMGGHGMLMWPSTAHHRDPKARLVYLYAFLAHLPATLAWHAERGIPEDVSWATFGDVGEKLRINRAIYGESGLDVSFWFTLHFRGSIYRLGRLQFDMHHSTALDGPVLGVHIPETGGPMSPEACEDSFERAREFFPKTFPEFGADKATCLSWLLDPRLGAALPDTNIARFGKLFTLLPADEEAGKNGTLDVLRFVFKRVVSAPERVDPAELPRDSTLRRVLADHIAEGGRWEQRGGWFSL
ncbi:acyltransferase domain-containing protein [Actinorhabdospora filicis]|uniref:acyltransferase domain-containing protein n=1 Tax=Actinorhabdospora filicis TaxID=1785913 RepID=UPI0025543B89|nr:acyltransferase domain-containing protein [Actinorhabdospora filicis]